MLTFSSAEFLQDTCSSSLSALSSTITFRLTHLRTLFTRSRELDLSISISSLFGVSVSILDFHSFLPLNAGFVGWALGKVRIISGESVASFLRIYDGSDPSGRDWEAACRSEVEDSFWAAPVGAGLSDIYDERKSSSVKISSFRG
jgi:hypothetical protein